MFFLFQLSVTLTLSSHASENIGGVISAIADLLKIAVPPYDFNRSPSPEIYRAPAVKRKFIYTLYLMRTFSHM